MKKNIIIAIISTASAIVALLSLQVFKEKVDYSCSGTYSEDISYKKLELSSKINIIINSRYSNKMMVNIDGGGDYNGVDYHINREIIYNLKYIDKANGLISITPESVKVNSSDNVSHNQILSALLGIEKNGKLVRIWKLNENTLLIGNPFSPIFTCSLIK